MFAVGRSAAQIQRLRLRGAGLDRLQSGLQAEGVLALADLCPAALSKDAVLIVRRLQDPMPGTLRLRSIGQSPAPAWQRALSRSLERLMKEAARPAYEVVPAAANAVLFADRSELLACLARDWCDGTLINHWWWRALLRQTEVSRVVLDTWLSRPEYIPAAIEHLDRAHKAVQFVAALAAVDVWSLLTGVAQAHGLGSLITVMRSLSSGESSGHGGSGSAAGREPQALEDAVVTAAASRQFRFLRGPVAAPLTAVQCVLLDMCLGLRLAPATVRSDTYLARVAVAMGAAPGEARHGPPKPKAHPPTLIKFEESVLARTAAGDPDFGDGWSIPDELPQIAPHEPPRGLPGANAFQNPVAREQEGGDGGPASHFEDPQPTINLAAASEVAESKPWCPDADRRIVRTGLGGAFYLINLGLFLELYGDFTTPLRPGIALSIWDFIALVAPRLRLRGYRRDPLWACLAELAARPAHCAPGADFAPPDEWRIPEFWLTPFGERVKWQAINDGERLGVIHPAGFLVLDVALEAGDPGAQLESEISPYLETARTGELPRWKRSTANLSPSGASPLRRWLGWLMPYLGARLVLALGVRDDRNLGRLLCRHQAQVMLRPTHLDITFSLADLPIEIRLSGLDRDPGWVPAAGRVIRFHYE